VEWVFVLDPAMCSQEGDHRYDRRYGVAVICWSDGLVLPSVITGHGPTFSIFLALATPGRAIERHGVPVSASLPRPVSTSLPRLARACSAIVSEVDRICAQTSGLRT
jgi:hypothetical protein